jgi:outer membrane protein OmpA-like peptidoglycan-associated protein
MSPAVLRAIFGSCLSLGLVDLAWLDSNAARLKTDGNWELLTRPAPAAPAPTPAPAPAPPPKVVAREEPPPVVTREIARPQPEDPPVKVEPATSCTVQFERSASAIPPGQLANLAPIAQAIKNDPRVIARITGHADRMLWKGNRGSNLSLSDDRALAVARALGQLGVPPDRIKRAALGDTRPVDDRATEDAYRRNRRVEVRIETTGER